jgi:DNA-binding beta-propeller fold protein YncE
MRISMLKHLPAFVLASLLVPAAVHAQEEAQSDIRLFAMLPERLAQDPNNPGNLVRLGHPEGITADSAGNVYAATFETSFENYIYVYDSAGALKVTLPIPAGQAPLGMVTDANFLYVNEVLNGDILQYQLPVTATSRPVRVFDICGGFLVAFGLGAPGKEFCALNANDLGPDGRLYMSDNGAGPSFSFSEKFRNGRIYVLDPRTGATSVWFDRDTRGELNVAFSSFPEFGVNGVAFSNDGSALFMANMSTDVVYKLPVRNCAVACEPATLQVFVKAASGLNGPDNIAFDQNGILWVASGQNDRIVAINPRGEIIGKFGRFEGFTRSGAPVGLLQPSGIIVVGEKVIVGNESSRGLRPTPDLVPEEQWDKLRIFTLSEVRTWQIITPR